MTTIETRALTAAIWLELHWRRFLTWRQRRRAAEVLRLTTPLPPPRVSLLPAIDDTRTDWPERLTPTDLAAAYLPRHHCDGMATDVGHQARHRSFSYALEGVTDTFHQIVEATWPGGEYRCSWCAEGDHQRCVRCSCPCSLQEAMA
jgi:hypothetical protein